VSASFSPSEDDWRNAVWKHIGDDNRYFVPREHPRRLPWQHVVYNDHENLQIRLGAHQAKAASAPFSGL
jgi:hypothetical protein